MADQHQSLHSSRPPQRRALLRYVVAWLIAGAVVAVIGLQLLPGPDATEVSLPPVRETKLEDAAVGARCELRHHTPGRAQNPPVAGPPTAAATRPGVYTTTPSRAGLVGALRRGIIVIHYRPSLVREQIQQLERLHGAVPEGTIVAPNPDMRYEAAATAWRRLLGCRRFEEQTVDAIRLFRGRYLGLGPAQ